MPAFVVIGAGSGRMQEPADAFAPRPQTKRIRVESSCPRSNAKRHRTAIGSLLTKSTAVRANATWSSEAASTNRIRNSLSLDTA